MMSAATLPTGTVTFLFSDIEGSTKLLQDHGDRYSELLADHHRLLREVFASHSGTEVSTEGDAFFVVFPDVHDSVNAVAAAQRALAGHDWGFEGGLKVRMGLHTGKGTLVGDNYGGLDVHLASRITSAAHGGQVLISGVTRSHIERSLPEGMRLKTIGTHRLKDLEHPEELSQLCIEGLRTDFPPPRTPDTRPNNLPARLNRFVARERELGELLSLLPRSRLITLTGPGGTGKTRLAVEVAYEKMLSFRDGTFVVFLAPLSDPRLVPSSVADALGLMEQGTRPIEESLKEFLQHKELLLVLDNFEQVMGAAPLVADLLAAAPDIRILVTTRIPLRVSGEQEFPVPPMAVPDPDRLPPLDKLQSYEAIDLFVERARAVNPAFALTSENAGTIVGICRQLDGLPLAIELAAARIKVLGLEDILRRLQEGLGILAGGARDRPSRQQTLRNAIAWSYDLLDPPAARFFRRLGVFSGGWTFSAAETICNPNGEAGIDSFEALEVLVENSLVRSFEEPSGSTRFRMLQTIREFAIELFGNDESAPEVKRRYASYFNEMSQQLEPQLTREGTALRDLLADHDNLRGALRWLIQESHSEEAVAMASSLWRFWQVRGHLAEGREWLTQALALPGAEEHTALRARGLLALGSITYWQNDWPPTRSHYEEALAIYRGIGDEKGTAEAAYNAGFLFLGLLEDDPARAKARFSEALEIFERLDDRPGQANALWGLAMAHTRAHEHEEAMLLGEKSGAIFIELNDWYGKELAAFVLIQNHRLMGDLDEAERMTLEQLDLTGESGDVLNPPGYFEVLADIWIAKGRCEEGLRIAAAGEAIRAAVGGGAPPSLLLTEDPREAAQAHLSKDRIDEIWAEGWAMSPEDAIAFIRKMGQNP